MVVVDTAIWVDYLAGVKTLATAALEGLIDDRQAAYTGVVLAELMRGMRTEDERSGLDLELSGARFLDMGVSTWRRAGAIAQDLDVRGLRMPMSDAFVAALVLEAGHELFTRDKHFERIPGLRLYKPEGDTQ